MDNRRTINVVLSKGASSKGTATLTYGKTKTTLVIKVTDEATNKHRVTILEFLKGDAKPSQLPLCESPEHDAVRLDSTDQSVSTAHGGHTLFGEKQHEGGLPVSI